MEEKAKEDFARNLFSCPFCSCVFCTSYDLRCHMAAYGGIRGEHLYRFRRNQSCVVCTSTIQKRLDVRNLLERVSRNDDGGHLRLNCGVIVVRMHTDHVFPSPSILIVAIFVLWANVKNSQKMKNWSQRRIVRDHRKNGVVRVRFTRGLPNHAFHSSLICQLGS